MSENTAKWNNALAVHQKAYDAFWKEVRHMEQLLTLPFAEYLRSEEALVGGRVLHQADVVLELSSSPMGKLVSARLAPILNDSGVPWANPTDLEEDRKHRHSLRREYGDASYYHLQIQSFVTPFVCVWLMGNLPLEKIKVDLLEEWFRAQVNLAADLLIQQASIRTDLFEGLRFKK